MCEFGHMGVGYLALSTPVEGKSFKDMQILVQWRQVMLLLQSPQRILSVCFKDWLKEKFIQGK